MGTTTVTTRWYKCGGAPRGPVSAMLPRLELLFSRCPPSTRSPQIRPHPVTVSHLSSSILFFRLPFYAACILSSKYGKAAHAPLAPRHDNKRLLSLFKMADRTGLCVCLPSRSRHCQIESDCPATEPAFAVAFLARSPPPKPFEKRFLSPRASHRLRNV